MIKIHKVIRAVTLNVNEQKAPKACFHLTESILLKLLLPSNQWQSYEKSICNKELR